MILFGVIIWALFAGHPLVAIALVLHAAIDY